MALPPKFKGHRLLFTGDAASTVSNEPLHTVEFYLDYVCPFSAKMFKTLKEQVIPHVQSSASLAPKVQFVFRQQIQPWHPSSTLAHEAALAVQRLAPDRFWDFSAALFARQAEYFDEAVLAEPRNETYRRLAELAGSSAGVDAGEVYKLLEVKGGGPAKNQGNAVTADVKLIVKMARLVGVHVSPTVVCNGVVVGEISSSWSGEQWVEWLEKNIV